MATVTPSIRTGRGKKSSLCTIHLRFEVSGKQATMSLDLTIHRSKWSKSRQRVINSNPEAAGINAEIEKQLARASEVLLSFRNSDRYLTAKRWRDGMKPEEVESDMITFIWGFTSEMPDKQHHYKRRLEALVHHLETCFGSHLDWDELDSAALYKFDEYLKKCGNAPNTRSKRFSEIKTICRKALLAGLAPDKVLLAFNRFEGPRKVQTESVTLSEEQIASLELAYLDYGPLEKLAVDVFLLAYYCYGMRFSDVITVKWKSFRDGRVNYKMRKNQKWVDLPLVDSGILTRYGSPETSEGYVFPFDVKNTVLTTKDEFRRISSLNAELNRELKSAARKAGLPEEIAGELSMHDARHSLAALLVKEGKSIHEMQGVLQHSQLATLQVYAKQLKKHTLDQVVKNLFPKRRQAS